MFRVCVAAAVAAVVAVAGPAEAQIFGAGRSSAQRAQDRQIANVPRCERPLGTLTIADGDPASYDALQLQPPQTLLRLVVQQSGCFTLVDRGSAAMTAIERERQLAMAGALQEGSNIGMGQMRAADYILLAEVASVNANVSGGGVSGHARSNDGPSAPERGDRRGGGLLGGLAGGLTGGLAGPVPGGSMLGLGGRGGGGVSGSGHLNTQTGEANTVLSVISVRTAETLATAQGYAARRDVDWSLGVGTAFGGAVGGGYENTETGRIVAQAFINAYADLVRELVRLAPTLDPVADAPRAN